MTLYTHAQEPKRNLFKNSDYTWKIFSFCQKERIFNRQACFFFLVKTFYLCNQILLETLKKWSSAILFSPESEFWMLPRLLYNDVHSWLLPKTQDPRHDFSKMEFLDIQQETSWISSEVTRTIVTLLYLWTS